MKEIIIKSEGQKTLKFQIDNPSKSEETEIIWALHGVYDGTDTYLKSLFSRALVDWVVPNIRNDFPCDVMEGGK